MASEKAKRKASRRKLRSQAPPTGPFRHRDGDRRRRGAISVDRAIALKRAMQQFGALVPDEDPIRHDPPGG